MKCNTAKFQIGLFYLCIVTSVLSQIDAISQYVKLAMYVLWALLLGTIVFQNNFKLPITKFSMVYFSVFLFILFEDICHSFFLRQDKFSINGLLSVLFIPLFLYVISNYLSPFMNEKTTAKVVFIYCFSSFVLSVYLLISFVPSLSSWLSTELYLYNGKNSAAQIMCSSAIILWVGVIPQRAVQTILKYAYIFFMLGVTLLFQCRTALLGTAIAILAFIVTQKISVKKRLWLALALIIVSIIALNNDTLGSIWKHALFIDKYKNSNLDAFSSGRLTYYTRALELFIDNWLFGVKDYYVDNFFINTLTALGVVGGLPVIAIWIYRLNLNMGFRKSSDNRIKYIVMILTYFYLIESLLEAYPPFGPGTCSFMFWFLCGLADKEKRNRVALQPII